VLLALSSCAVFSEPTIDQVRHSDEGDSDDESARDTKRDAGSEQSTDADAAPAEPRLDPSLGDDPAGSPDPAVPEVTPTVPAVEDPLQIPLEPPESDRLCEEYGYTFRLARAESLARQKYWAESGITQGGVPEAAVSAPCVDCLDFTSCPAGECGAVTACLERNCFCDGCLVGLAPAAACDCIERCLPDEPEFEQCMDSWNLHMQCQVDTCRRDCRL
jgi:hypothetical protein